MSLSAKTIAVSAIALLAVAGGLYASMPGGQESDPNNSAPMTSAQTVAETKAKNSQDVANGQITSNANAKSTNAIVAAQTDAAGQPANQAPKKLTRAQLTPPPATEEEKLQRAAEQESNF